MLTPAVSPSSRRSVVRRPAPERAGWPAAAPRRGARALAVAVALGLVLSLGLGCGNNGGGGSSDPDAATGDGAGGADAAPFPGTCDPNSGPQCANCRDDDGDGKVDGFDLQCSGPLDNDEGSFGTGIPGDNIDAINQDCFFDGNSGGGNDGCNQHVCCLLGATSKADCATKLTGLVNNPSQEGSKYNIAECFPPLGSATVPDKCVRTCGPLTPPGCDCFGCCTVCDPAIPGTCYDLALNPTTSPGCTTDNLSDPAICKRCTKVAACGNTQCGGDTCVLCPGQDPSTLPATCNGAACPEGIPACGQGGTCDAGRYCANGCCIEVAQ